MIAALIAVPAVAGLGAFALRSDRLRRALLPLIGLAHAAATVWVCAAAEPPSPELGGWLALDAPGKLFLAITSGLFLCTSIYAVGYLAREGRAGGHDVETGLLFANAPEAVFTGCLLLFLSTMTLVVASHHFGLLWVGIEATTLASAPLIYFHRHPRSLEATWKYLLICSVGIGLALLGNFFIAVSAEAPGRAPISLVLGELVAKAGLLDDAWLKVAFLCLLVGYGTKMGLAPLHTWLPDAHSESPSVVSALLSGALLNCAFLGLLRVQQVAVAAGQGAFGQDLLVVFGLVSMGFGAVFILKQADYKRMLAYSSVEHMGILALGIGLGGAGAFGAMLHTLNHSLTKGLLFLVAGNILAEYGTKASASVRGALRVLPVSGFLWVAGLLAITGTPPFGPFLSEFTILKSALDQGRGGVAAAYLIMLALVFVSMSAIVLRMAQGAPEGDRAPRRERLASILPPAVLAAAVLALGLYVPPALSRMLHECARLWGGA